MTGYEMVETKEEPLNPHHTPNNLLSTRILTELGLHVGRDTS